MSTYILPEILSLSPYSSARDEFKGKAEVLLDANENPFGDVNYGNLNRYPDPRHTQLKVLIASNKFVKPDQLILGNGSDEVLDLLLRAVARPYEHTISITPPTYGMYSVLANINRLKINSIPLQSDFSIDSETIQSDAEKSRVLFLCNPNNPTGALISKITIEKIVQEFSGIVVVDEAYIDFSPEHTALPLIQKYQNIVVTQTLSKAWGLAGIRVGMLFANSELISGLSRIKMPYNINSVSQKIALARLQQTDRFTRERDLIIVERLKVATFCHTLPNVETVYPSAANFILVKFKDAAKVFLALQQQGIIVRDRTKEPLLSCCIRITISSTVENITLMNELTEIS